jgi:hypothetical protein
MSSEDFKSLCLTKLSAEDASVLDDCSLDPDPQKDRAVENAGSSYSAPPAPSPSDFINKWRYWERTLRLNLARFRAQRIKRELAQVEAPDDPADAAAVAKAALALESPLEAELFLDSSRWKAVETFQGIDYFSRDIVYAYLIKLLLLERRSSFKTEEGFAEYKRLYAAVMDKALAVSSGS